MSIEADLTEPIKAFPLSQPAECERAPARDSYLVMSRTTRRRRAHPNRVVSRNTFARALTPFEEVPKGECRG